MILLFISLMLYLLQNFSNKQYSRTVNRGGFSVILVQNCLCLLSAVVFPLTSGFLVVALWFASYLFYHETKLTWKNSLAMIFCVLAIIILNL